MTFGFLVYMKYVISLFFFAQIINMPWINNPLRTEKEACVPPLHCTYPLYNSNNLHSLISNFNTTGIRKAGRKSLGIGSGDTRYHPSLLFSILL
jgi:hypothetical protein